MFDARFAFRDESVSKTLLLDEVDQELSKRGLYWSGKRVNVNSATRRPRAKP